MKRMFVLFILVILAFGVIRASEARAEEGRTYLVQPRDRLERVAEHFGTTAGEIISANPPRAFIRECIGQREVTLRSGETVTFCRKVHYGLIAGRTLFIPAPRLLVESENVRLGAENTALEAERDQARAELETLRQERDALREERDRLASSNAELARANTAMANSTEELARRYSEARAAADADSVNRRIREVESRETTVTVIAVIAAVIVVLSVVFVWWSRRPLRNLERDRASLELTRKGMAGEAEDLVRRRRVLDEQEQAARLAAEREQTRQKEQRDQLTRWEESLAQRKDQADARTAEQDKREKQLDSRERACTDREAAAARRETELSAEASRLQTRDGELSDRERDLEELKRELAGQKADQELTGIRQGQRDVELNRRAEEFAAHCDQAAREAAARNTELDLREEAIDAKVRMYDDDIAPAIVRKRQELADQMAALEVRQREFAERASATIAADALAKTTLESAQRKDAQADLRLRELEEAQRSLADDQRSVEDARQDLARREEEFSQRLNEAKNVLARAGRKKEVIHELDRREGALSDREAVLQTREEAVAASEEAIRTLAERQAAVYQREQACDTREGALEAWEERLVAREGLPRARGPHRPTLSPPPLPLPAAEFPLGASAGDDDVPTLLALSGGEADPGDITYVDPPGAVVSKCLCPHCGQEIPLGREEEHKPVCTGQRDASSETGPHIPVAEQSTPHSESSFWCTLCNRDIPMDDMEKHNALHREQEKPGPLDRG